MRVQIIDDIIVAWGTNVFGDNTYEDAPNDYSPELYDYIPQIPGEFNINNFILKLKTKEE